MMCCQVDKDLTLLETKTKLEEVLKDLMNQKDERLSRLRELKDAERQLCTELTKKPCDVRDGTLPSLKQLDQLKDYIHGLECEKVRI